MNSTDKENQIDTRVAIICEHIAKAGLPILRAVRAEPLENADSGWQFVCNSGAPEDENGVQVWPVNEVLAIEPGLAPFLDENPGTVLERANAASHWLKIQPNTGKNPL